MPRRYDADLCRHHGWEVGDVLEFGPAADAPPPHRCFNYYVLSAIGHRAILCRDIRPMYDRATNEYIKDQYVVDETEQVFRGQLHQHVIRRVGTWRVEDGKNVFDMVLIYLTHTTSPL